nr:hypothetical protein B0A51_17696 [Rachicladosporium sp. CCFEE 5018]
MLFPCFLSTPRLSIDEKVWMRPSSDTQVSARIKWWNAKAATDNLSLQQTHPETYVRAKKFKDLLNSFGRKSVTKGEGDKDPKGCIGIFAGRKTASEPKLAPRRHFTVIHSSIQAKEQSELRQARSQAVQQARLTSVQAQGTPVQSAVRSNSDRSSKRLSEPSKIHDCRHSGSILQKGDKSAPQWLPVQQATPSGTEMLRVVVSSTPEVLCSSPAFLMVPTIMEADEDTTPITYGKRRKASAGPEIKVPTRHLSRENVLRQIIDNSDEQVETGDEAVAQRPLSNFANNRKRPRPNKGNQHIHSSSSSGTSTGSSSSLFDSTSTRSSSPPSTVAVQVSPNIEPSHHRTTNLARAHSSASPAYVSDDKGNITRVASIRAKVTMDTTDPKERLTHPSSLIPGGSGQRAVVTRKPVPGSRPTSVIGWTPPVPLWQQPANTATFSKYTAYNPGFRSFAETMSEDPWYQTPGEPAEESKKYRSDKDLDAEMPDFDTKPNAAAVKHLTDLENGVVGDEFRVAAQHGRQLRSAQRPPHLQRSSVVTKSSAASSLSSATSSPRTPKPHRMNSNRYPVHSPDTARGFSAKPVYTRGGQDKGEAWDQKRKEDKALADKERRKAAKLALKEAKAHTEKQAGKPCEGCDNCKGADVGKNMLIY